MFPPKRSSAWSCALPRHVLGYTGDIDGDPGPNTIKALQRLLKDDYGYTGAIDGVAGPGTRAAFKRFAA